MQTILKIVTMLMIKGDLMANSGMWQVGIWSCKV
jgi:hypothetical protein